MTPLQQAAAALMDAMVQTDFTCRLGEQLDALEKALADEQAQAVEPVAWLVLDEDRVPIMCAPAKQMCNDHINDAINDFDITEASKWVVREAFTHPAPPAKAQQVAVHAGYALAMAVLQSSLHQFLDDVERSECDALIAAAQGAKP